MVALIEGTGLTKVYRSRAGEVRAIENVDATVAPGRCLVVRGPSGSGKSTLLHLLGLLDRPTVGSIRLEGKAVERIGAGAAAGIRNRRFGFVFQSFHLLPEFTALENVLMPGRIGGRADRKRAREILDRVGLADRVRHRPSRLSGGERQRVAIARALFNDPEAIFCDEPTGNLDAESKEQILGILSDLKKRTGCALVIATHDPSLAALADGTIRLRGGQMDTETKEN